MAAQSVRFVSVTIANGEAPSGAFEFQNMRVVGVIFPSAWTAADLTFDVEWPSGTYVKAVDRAGAAYKLTGVATSASEYHLIAGDANQGDIIITGPGLGRVVSTNTASEVDVTQGAARTVIVILVG